MIVSIYQNRVLGFKSEAFVNARIMAEECKVTKV